MALLAELGPGAHLWVISLNERPRSVSIAHLLSSEERRRMNAFASAQLGGRYLVARAALRILLGAELGMPAKVVALGIDRNGKPRLPSDAPVQFNLSHSEDIAVIGLTNVGRIGVDIEAALRIRDARRVARRFFAEREAAVIARLPDDLVDMAFMRCWTGKEAVLKALGVGLRQPLRDVVIDADPRREARLLRVPGPDPATSWTLHERGLCHSRMRLAVATEGSVNLARVHRFRLSDWPG